MLWGTERAKEKEMLRYGAKGSNLHIEESLTFRYQDEIFRIPRSREVSFGVNSRFYIVYDQGLLITYRCCKSKT